MKTLATLTRHGIPSDKIFVFVAPEEMAEYQTALPGVQIRSGALGLAQNRNAVSASFPEGSALVWMDDDVKGFVTKRPDNRLLPVEDLDAFFKEGFRRSQEAGASLWGLYPVANGKWLKNSVSEGLVFCYGCAFGLWNRKDILIEQNYKEDVERSLKFYERDGKVIRLNWVAPVQSYLKGKGGLNETRSYDKEVSECMKIQSKFPTLVSVRHKKDRVDLVFPRKLSRTIPLADAAPRSLRRRSDASATSAPGDDDTEKPETV